MSARLVAVDELVTIDDIAKRLKISVNIASNIAQGRDGRKKVKFPKPLVGNAKRGVWLWEDVEEWLRATAPKEEDEPKKKTQTTFKQPCWTQGQKSA